MRRLIVALSLLPFAVQAAEVAVPVENRTELAVTLYNGDLAVVRDRREAMLPGGDSRLLVTGISPSVLADSVHLSGDGLAVNDQTVTTEVPTPNAVLRRAVGSEVTLVRPAAPGGGEQSVRGRLLAAEGPVLDIGGHVEVAPPGRLVFDRLPNGLAAEPSLSAAVHAPGGKRGLELSYLTSGLSWRADYRVQLAAEEDKADVSAWAVLNNGSGMAFAQAKLALVAGDLHRAAAPLVPVALRMTKAAAAPAAVETAAGGEPLAGATLYTVPGLATLMPGETKAVRLFAATGVAARRELVADPAPEFVYLRPQPEPAEARPAAVLVVEDKSGAMPVLPAGAARVYKDDAAGLPQLIGEDTVRQRAKGEPLRLTLGRDGEVGVTRQQTGFRPARQPDDSTESAWQVTLANHKGREVVVQVRDVLPVNGSVVDESQAHQQPDARTVVWPVTVPAGGQVTLTYKVRATPR